MSFWEHIFAFNEESPLLFTQFYFWAFFALVYALFALIMAKVEGRKAKVDGQVSNGRLHLRNVYLLFVSWFFYYKTSGLFLLILAFITISDWLIAGRIKASGEGRKAKGDKYIITPIKYAICFILFERILYEEMGGFNVVPETRSAGVNGDEGQIMEYCMHHCKCTVIACNTLCGHFSYPRQEKKMINFKQNNNIYFEIRE